MADWRRERLLILGMTYPSYSKKYMENVCTGALVGDSLEMVRIHPIPRRYLAEDLRFKSYQWITADVAPHAGDSRPESLRIRPDTIELGAVVSSGRGKERGRLVRGAKHLFRSVEDLLDRQKADGTSLGIIKPSAITGFRLEARSQADLQDWLDTEHKLSQQKSLFERPPMKIDFPDTRFKVEWTCDDGRCTGHSMSMQDWGLHELWRKLSSDPERVEKTIHAMKRRMERPDQEVYLYLGNFRTRLYQFGLMGALSVPPDRQIGMF